MPTGRIVGTSGLKAAEELLGGGMPRLHSASSESEVTVTFPTRYEIAGMNIGSYRNLNGIP